RQAVRLSDLAAHGLAVGTIIGLAETGGTGHKSVGACGRHAAAVANVDAAINLEGDVVAALLLPGGDALSCLTDLDQAVLDECLPAKAWVDGHDQHHVNLVHDMIQPVKRCGRIEYQTRPAAIVADQRQGAIHMAAGFGVKSDDVGPGLCKLGDEGIHRLDHEVDIDGCSGKRTQGGTNHGTHGEIGHIVVVHDVEMNPVSSGINNVGHFFAQAGKISSK